MAQTRYISMEEIARRAGVSKSTVSRALRNHPRISTETRQKIATVARDAGYRKDPLFTALSARLRSPSVSAPVIAYVFLEPFNPDRNPTSHGLRYLEGARCHGEKFGYLLQDFWPLRDNISIPKLSRVFQARGIGGVILSSSSAVSREMNPRELAPLWSRFPIALVGHTFRTLPLYRAYEHQFFNTLLGLTSLTDRGYRRPGLIVHKSLNRHVFFQHTAAAVAHREELAMKRCVPPLLLFDLSGGDAFMRWFNKSQPDALLSAEPLVRSWLDKAGIQVPRDVAYASLNTNDSPGMAGINPNSQGIGAAAVDLIIGQLHRNEIGIPSMLKEVLVPASWVDGPTAPKRRTTQ